MHMLNKHQTQSADLVSDWIDEIGHLLPAQGPLKDFIHHNTLHAFQDRPFFEACLAAYRIYGAEPLMSETFYQSKFAQGVISPEFLKIREREQEPEFEELEPSSAVVSDWDARLGFSLSGVLKRPLVRYLSHFLDQGIAIHAYSYESLSFYDWIRQLDRESLFGIFPGKSEKIRECLKLEPRQAIERALGALVLSSEHRRGYLSSTAFCLPGWAGLVHQIELNPGYLNSPRKIALDQWLAFSLLYQWSLVEKTLGANFAPVSRSNHHEKRTLPIAWKRRKALHQAFEDGVYQQAFDVLSAAVQGGKNRGAAPAIEVQAIFCIDDRECSIRRYLEAMDASIQTYSTAGFFGIDMLYQGYGKREPVKLCPAPVKPRHLVREQATRVGAEPSPTRTDWFMSGAQPSFIRGWLTTQAFGLLSSFRLALDLFRPSFSPLTSSSLTWIEEEHELLYTFDPNRPKTEDGLQLGYTLEEKVARVAGVLKGMGLTSRFANLVAVVAHGSSSANNPHFAAYDCGACSGRPGVPNARVFCSFANETAVRLELAKQGIVIPETTYFQPALHDTSQDQLRLFDQERTPLELRSRLNQFRDSFLQALKWNSRERTRRFESAPDDGSIESAHEHVRERSQSLFEPRPELNHATNALCVIAPRRVTEPVFFDRRAFLQSYEPSSDPDGLLLSGILNAVVPVCGGINLEYFFSRVDPMKYGSDSKLSHNVVGLIGVSHGVESDLEMGLPTQMTEVHDPVRILFVAAQKPEIIELAAKRNPATWEWIANGWVHLASLDDLTGKIQIWKSGQWMDVQTSDQPPRIYERLEDTLRDSSENLSFGLWKGGRSHV